MGKLYDDLMKHFENTSQEELDKEWEEIKSLNDIGPDAIEYANWIKEYKNKLEIKYFELFKKAREEDKQKLISEARRYLKENIDEGLVIHNNRTWKSRDRFINDFCETMEDLK